MNIVFAANIDGTFGQYHLILLGISIVLIIGLSILVAKTPIKFSTIVNIMLVLWVLSEATKMLSNMSYLIEGADGKYRTIKIIQYIGEKVKEGDIIKTAFYPRGQLPFHLCSIQPIFILLVKFTKNEKLKDTLLKFIFPTATLGAFIALVVCTIKVNFANPQLYEYFLFHISLTVFAISIVTKKQIEITWKSHLKTLGLTFLMFVSSIWINSLLSDTGSLDPNAYTNFFYSLKEPTKGLPILNLNNGWFAYFFSIVLIGLTAISLLQLPFIINSALKAKKQKQLS